MANSSVPVRTWSGWLGLHMCNCPVESRKHCFLAVFHHLQILNPVPSLKMIPEPLEERWDTDIPFTAEHSTVSYSLPLGQL